METIKTLADYKKLTVEEKDFYHFEQLKKIDHIHRSLDKRYAQKRVEYIVYGFVGLILVGFATALINLVGK